MSCAGDFDTESICVRRGALACLVVFNEMRTSTKSESWIEGISHSVPARLRGPGREPGETALALVLVGGGRVVFGRPAALVGWALELRGGVVGFRRHLGVW